MRREYVPEPVHCSSYSVHHHSLIVEPGVLLPPNGSRKAVLCKCICLLSLLEAVPCADAYRDPSLRTGFIQVH